MANGRSATRACSGAGVLISAGANWGKHLSSTGFCVREFMSCSRHVPLSSFSPLSLPLSIPSSLGLPRLRTFFVYCVDVLASCSSTTCARSRVFLAARVSRARGIPPLDCSMLHCLYAVWSTFLRAVFRRGRLRTGRDLCSLSILASRSSRANALCV